MTVRRFLITMFLVVAAFAGGGVLAHYYVIPAVIHRQNEILVPEVVGLELEEARRRTDGLGLGLEIRGEVFDAEQPPGVVLEQSPAATKSIRAGRAVRVVVSKGESLVQVPDLLGMTLRQSEITLLGAGLQVGRVSRSYDPTGALGVVAQRPHPGLERTTGTPVDLHLREGHQRIQYRAPDLVGRDLARVRQALNRGGFELRHVTYRNEPNVMPGVVLEQWPTAGSQIPMGGSFELVAATRN